MSRSTKGFADFFPTAPSVLQQKRSKAAQSRRRPKSPAPGDPKSAHGLSTPSASLHGQTAGAVITNGTCHDHVLPDPAPAAQEESECAHGDLLNGVGSASSTSTVSSVFSTSHRTLGMSQPGEHKSTSLTPLTNIDSSPPSNTLKSPHHQRVRDGVITNKKPNRSPSHHETAEKPAPIDTLRTTPSDRTQARPGRGEAKGVKIIYDAYRNKKLPPDERHSGQVQYETFGEKVSLRIEITVVLFF